MKDVKTDSLKVLANVSRNYECSKIIADSGTSQINLYAQKDLFKDGSIYWHQ